MAFDPRVRPRLWSEREGGDPDEGAQAARHAFASVLEYVDVLLPSLPSDGILWEGEGDAVASLRDPATVRGIPLVAAKAGAGDAWNAAFLHYIGTGRAVDDAAEAAHAVARSLLGHRGAIAPHP